MSESGAWASVRTACFGGTPPGADAPVITAGLVLRELRRVGLPALQVRTQPAEKTLVNFDTIFYTEPTTVTRDLTLLAQQVHVEATPATYAWAFGDGAQVTTSTPGDPYPATTITHRYATADTTMRPHVTVSYTARFRVATGPWQDIDGTVTIPGPTSDLRIAEAVPVLSGQHS